MNYLIKLLPWLCYCGLVLAQAPEQPIQITPRQEQATEFIRSKIGTSDDLKVHIEGFGEASDSAPCLKPEFFIPGQLPVLRGTIRIGLRCNQPSSWVIYSNATIIEAQTIFKLKNDLPSGHLITADDLTAVKVFQKMPTTGSGEQVASLVGRILLVALPAGTILQHSQTQTNWIIKGGQTVTVYSQGPAFRISLEGQAMGNAAAGQSISVRTNSGKILTGQVLPDGTVELSR